MKLDLAHATAVLEAGIEGSMFQGAMPEGSGNRITSAGELVELALQARVVADEIGRDNVPAWPALERVLTAAGLDVNAPTTPPLAVEPDDQPLVPPVDAAPTSGLPAVGERWLDAEGNAWDVVEYDGGPQMQARLVSTGETAVVPAGLLVGRSPPEAAALVAPAGHERRFCAGNDTVYELESIDGETVFVLDPTGARMSIAMEHWGTWPVQERVPSPPPAPPEPEPPAAEVAQADEPQVDPEPSLDAPERRLRFVVGEHRLSAVDGNAYVLKEVHPSGTVTITDIYGGQETEGPSAAWMGWEVLDSTGVQASQAQPQTDPDAAVADPPDESPASEVAEPEPEPKAKRSRAKSRSKIEQEVPAEPARHDDQQVVVPEDEDEGDDEYAAVLARVRDTYSPAAMPAPMDLEHPPSGMPDDLTMVDDVEARRLHSQFNALASRARYLYGLEAAKSRSCERLYKHHLKHAMRASRAELGKDWSVTEVQQHAEDNEIVANWMRRRDAHGDVAEAYKTFLATYSEHVTVLSRDWSMRAKELAGS